MFKEEFSLPLSEVLGLTVFHKFVTLSLSSSNTLNLETCSKHLRSKSSTLDCAFASSLRLGQEKSVACPKHMTVHRKIPNMHSKAKEAFLGLLKTLVIFYYILQTHDQFQEIIYNPPLTS